MSSKDDIYFQIRQSGNLPPLPEILLHLLRACEDENTPLSAIADIISRDPGFSFGVLKLVNSAYYGFRYTFTSIEQAVIYLGAGTIKNLAVTLSVKQVFHKNCLGSRCFISSGAFWFHSLLTATIAKNLAMKTGFSSQEEAYLSGLLHDLGILILASSFPEEFARISGKLQKGEDQLLVETQEIGVDHCKAGAWLAQKWNLNSLITDAIRYHHDPLDQVSEALPLVKIVYLANLLAEQPIAREDDVDTARNCQAGKLLFALQPDDLKELVVGAQEEVEQVAVQMGIEISPFSSQGPNTETSAASAQQSDSTAGMPVRNVSQGSATEEIAGRVKNISLLTSFLEKLVQAPDRDTMLQAFEQSQNILFSIEKLLFFLPNYDGVLLTGWSSSVNRFFEICKGLSLPVQQSTSLIARTYREMKSSGYLCLQENPENLSDQQILTVLSCEKALTVPLVADQKAIGVAVLGMPPDVDILAESDFQLIRTIAQQLALCMQLEENKARRAEQLHAERMAAISMSAKKFAHEINNPLGIISNYLMMMKMKLGGAIDVVEELGIIDEEIQRLTTMVSQMEMFSQSPVMTTEIIDINEVVRDVVQLANASLFARAKSKVTFVPGSEIKPLRSSKDAIKQILINLLKNSVEAMKNGGRAMVRTRKAVQNDAKDAEAIEIIIADTGPGLPEEVLANLYKPFVTTKKNGHSGLGLSIVAKTVNDLGGRLSCSSISAEGTTFTICLPLNSTVSPALPG